MSLTRGSTNRTAHFYWNTFKNFFLIQMVEDAERYNERGKVEFQKKNFEAALQQYTHALQCLPDDQHDYRVKYLYNRAACYVNLVGV